MKTEIRGISFADVMIVFGIVCTTVACTISFLTLF